MYASAAITNIICVRGGNINYNSIFIEKIILYKNQKA